MLLFCLNRKVTKRVQDLDSGLPPMYASARGPLAMAEIIRSGDDFSFAISTVVERSLDLSWKFFDSI
jgi:hypothetical protein